MSEMQSAPPPEPPAQVRPATNPLSEGRSVEILATLAIVVVVIVGLYFGRDVLVPLTLAGLLTFAIAPLVDFLRRLHFGRVPSVFVAMLCSVAVMIVLGGVIGSQVAGLAGDIPRYEKTVESKVDEVRVFASEKIDRLVSSATQMVPRTAALPIPAKSPHLLPTPGTAGAPIAVEVREPPVTPLQVARRIISPVVSPLATAGIVIVVAIFILLQRQDLKDRLIRLSGSHDLHRTTMAMDEAATRLGRYLVAQLSINTCFGVVVWIGLWVIGVPSAGLWGVLAGLLRFVPYVGTWIAAAAAVAMAAAVDPNWSMAIWTLVLFVSLDIITGQVVEPMIYGHSTGLSPFSVIIAAIFWGAIWGPVGLILSTPLTLCLVILGRHVKRLEFLDILLGDRPALSPSENFYQRLLAGDGMEALRQAEQLLRDASLAEYYQQVAIPGLRLAANDIARGVVTPAQLERIKHAVMLVVEGLNDSSDSALPPPRAVAGSDGALQEPFISSLPRALTVTCVTGRGPLDAVAVKLVVQLLEARGMTTSEISGPSLSRGAPLFGSGRASDVVCVFSLDMRPNSLLLRQFIQRLRSQAPATRFVIGLVRPDADAQGEVDEAVYYSLSALIESCASPLAVTPTHTPQMESLAMSAEH